VSFDNEVKAATRRHATRIAIVLAPALVASEDDIAAIVGKIADILKRSR